jgi:hypothetical protein
MLTKNGENCQADAVLFILFSSRLYDLTQSDICFLIRCQTRYPQGDGAYHTHRWCPDRISCQNRFRGTSGGGGVGGSGQGSDPAGSSEIPREGTRIVGMTGSVFFRESGIMGIFEFRGMYRVRSEKTVLTMCPGSDDRQIFI